MVIADCPRNAALRYNWRRFNADRDQNIRLGDHRRRAGGNRRGRHRQSLAQDRRAEFKRPRVGWLVFIVGLLATAAIWAVPAYLRDHGLYLHQVIFQRDLNLAEAVQKKPFYLYFGVGFLLSLPLSIFLPAALLDCRRHGYSSFLAMAAAILLVFSCVPKKRDHYLLPMYPFLALGIATAIVRRSETSLLVRRVTWTLVPLSLAA